MKIGPLKTVASSVSPEIVLDLIKDYLVITLSFYVPHMSQEEQDQVFSKAPQLRGKNYSQLFGDFSPIDGLSIPIKHDLLLALAHTRCPYTHRAAGHYANRLEELGLVRRQVESDFYQDQLDI